MKTQINMTMDVLVSCISHQLVNVFFFFPTYLMPQFVTKNQGPTFLASHKCIKTENKCYNLDVGGTKCLYLENEQGFQFHLKLEYN